MLLAQIPWDCWDWISRLIESEITGVSTSMATASVTDQFTIKPLKLTQALEAPPFRAGRKRP
jgi:hypothetical protein